MNGFATVGEQGRISFSKPVRRALGLQAGSSVAYIVLDHTLLLIPQDEQLAHLMERGARTLTAVGLTTGDLLDALPEARAEVMTEAYGADFMQDLQREHAAPHGKEVAGDEGNR